VATAAATINWQQQKHNCNWQGQNSAQLLQTVTAAGKSFTCCHTTINLGEAVVKWAARKKDGRMA